MHNRLTSTFHKALRAALAWSLSAVLAAPVWTPAPLSAEESVAASGYAVLKEIRIKDNRITIRLDKPATTHSVFKLASPPRAVLELDNTENGWKMKSVNLKNNAFFSKVRSGQFQNEPSKITRVVIELKQPADVEASADGMDIVLTAKASDGQTTDAAAPQEPPMTAAPTPNASPDELIKQETLAAEPPPLEPVTEAVPQPSAMAEPEPEPAYVPRAPIMPTAPASITGRTASEASSLFGRQNVTLDFYDIDVRDLFKILGDKSGINIVYTNSVSGVLSIQLKDVPFKDAVDTILALKSLKMVAMGKNILQVMTSEEFDLYRTKAISVTKVFPINYAKASDVNTQLTAIVAALGGKGKAIVDDRTNSLIVTDTPEGIESMGALIADLDKPTPQVMIEAKIVQVSMGKSVDFGISWGTAYTDRSGNQQFTVGAARQPISFVKTTPDSPGAGFHGNSSVGLNNQTPLVPGDSSDLEAKGTGFAAASGLGFTLGFVKDTVRLNAALSALTQKNKSKLLSNPKVATLNNQAAVIKSETSEPFITTEVSFSQGQSLTSQKVNTSKSGISLTVTPTINADGRITMKIVPDVTSSQPTQIGVPKTTSQQANTTVIVKDGETLVIGGLISEVESEDKAYVPFLGSIPLIGHLFKKTGSSRQRAELLVFVTPKIIPF